VDIPGSVLLSQSTFRSILEASARPGSVQPLDGCNDAPRPLSPGAAAIAVTLCDHDTPVWLDPPLSANDAVVQWFRFNCGCAITADPKGAAFAFTCDTSALVPLAAFNLGSTDYPDRSTTVVAQVESLETGKSLTLAGPGICGTAVLNARPLPVDVVERLAANRRLFPRGVDLLLVTATAVAALPRSVQIVEN
jgi:alpha-D-ribose 1-methylphosphonate 5-triphosphate synthase subunit PhnH